MPFLPYGLITAWAPSFGEEVELKTAEHRDRPPSKPIRWTAEHRDRLNPSGPSPLFLLFGIDRKILNVGEELWKETLPLQMGSRLYLLEGVKSYTSYEVKISYPASIPSRFSLLLTRGNSSIGQNWKRKLLNTEKLIFKTDNLELSSDQDGMYVLVNVEPEGVVALPNVQERKEVIFNIVCDELLLFIPQHAWWVVILVVLCLGSAAVIPRFLPSYFLRTNRSPQSASRITSKDS